MLLFYIGFQAIKFYCFPSTTTTFPLFSSSTTTTTATATTFYRFPLTTTTATTSTFLLFSILLLLVSFFSPRDSIKDCQLPSLVRLVSMSCVVNNNRGFLQLLADCPVHQRQFLLKTAIPQQLHSLVQVLYNILRGHISIPEENKRVLQSYKDALPDLARPNVRYKTNKGFCAVRELQKKKQQHKNIN